MADNPVPRFQQLQLEYVQDKLQALPIGRILFYHRQLPSTMPVAHRLAGAGQFPAASSGTVVLAEEQTAGRGRLQRRWEASPGRGLLLSIIIAGNHLPDEPVQLPMIAGLAVLDAMRTAVPALSRHLWLKWPNDVLVLGDGAAGKLSGILIESSFGMDALDYAVLGIGINVNQRPSELPPPRAGGLHPASFYTILGREVSREDLLVALCSALSRLLAQPKRPHSEKIHRLWQASLIGLGRPVAVHDRSSSHPTAPIKGTAVGTTLTGSLIVETSDGIRQVVEAGDAEFVWGTG